MASDHDRQQRPSFIAEGEELWRGQGVFQILDEIWCLADGRRYVELRGDTSSGKSTVLNLLLGFRAVEMGVGQVTGCVEEIRPLPAAELADEQPRLVTVDDERLEQRLRHLHEHGDSDADRFDAAAAKVRRRLAEEGLDLGRTVSLGKWAEWGFSTKLIGDFYSVVAVDRVIRPVGLPPDCALPEAAAGRISFIDVPGTADEMYIVGLMRDAADDLRPAVTVRVWDAAETDAPPAAPGEILVINKADTLAPQSRLQVTDRTARRHGGKLVMMSAAADAPPGFDPKLPPRSDAQQALDTLAASLQEAGYKELLTPLRETTAHPRGGIGVLADVIRGELDDLDEVGDPGHLGAVVQRLAGGALESLARLTAQLDGPFTPQEARLRIKAAAETGRQKRLETARQVARRDVYGPPDLPVWSQLLDDLGTLEDRLGELRQHLRQADAAARAALGLTGEATLDSMAEPLLGRFRQLRGRTGDGQRAPGQLSFVDVARVRSEVANLLAWGLAREIDTEPLDEPAMDQSRIRADVREARKRRRVLQQATTWTRAMAGSA